MLQQYFRYPPTIALPSLLLLLFFCQITVDIRIYIRLISQRYSRAGPTDAEEDNNWVAVRDRFQVKLI